MNTLTGERCVYVVKAAKSYENYEEKHYEPMFTLQQAVERRRFIL